jgi:hypothetical protein
MHTPKFCLVRHYGKQGAHGKGQKTHGKPFVVRFSSGRTAKGARQHFARRSPFAVRRAWQRTVDKVCRAFFHDARQTKATNGTGAKRRGTTFAVRREQNARQTFSKK